MSPPAQVFSVKELNRAISGGNLECVYLLHGEEEFNKESKIQKLIETALDASERDFNLDVRYAGDLNAEVLDSVLNTPPLLANRRVVVIRDVTAMKKGARQILERYLASPAQDLLLILVESGPLAKSEKTLPTMCSVVEFPRLARKDLEKWVEQYAGSGGTGGARITQEAAKLLLDVVGDDMGELASELDKLASYSANNTIDVSAVEDLVGVRHGETVGDLLDAIAFRDLNRALSLLGHVLSQSRTTGVSLVLALTTQTLGLAYARALLDEGVPTSRLYKALFDFLSAGKGLTARPWGEAVNCWARAAGLWTSSELQDACEMLLRADISLKDTRSSSDEQLLTSLILELCAREKPATSKGH